MTIYSGEVDPVTDDVAVMRPLHSNIDAPSGAGKADRVSLFKASDPDLIVELKDIIGVRFVRLGLENFSIINISGKPLPRIFPKDTPFAQHFSLKRYFDDHIQAGVCD